MEVELLVLDRAPQALGDTLSRQAPRPSMLMALPRALTSQVCIEDLWLTVPCKRFFQRI